MSIEERRGLGWWVQQRR